MVNILFCGNGYVFDGMLTCALSILKRSESTEPYTFYVYTMDVSHLKPAYTPIPDPMIGFFDTVIKSYNPENRVVKTDVTDLYMKHFSGCPNEGAYCSPYTLIRLFADLIDGMPDKLLYLDADIMFNRDIHLLYDTDISLVEYAAARDHYGKYLLNPNYVNAGVLLFNMKKIKETGLLEKAEAHVCGSVRDNQVHDLEKNAPSEIQRSEIPAQAHRGAPFFKAALLAAVSAHGQHKAVACQPRPQGLRILLLRRYPVRIHISEEKI